MKRILTTSALIPFAIYSIYFGPHWFFIGVVLLMAALCHWEYAGIVERFGLPSPRVPGLVLGSILILYPPVALVLAIAALAFGMRTDLKRSLPAAGALMLGLFYIFGAWRCAIDLHAISPNWILFALAVNWVGDVAALYTGRTFGRHKLSPVISPGKSWEGAAGSMVAALLFGYLFATHVETSLSPIPAMFLAAVANIFGQVGDLAESALKRGAGVKDSGSLLPGHGGVLDRLDSSLFTLPVVWAALSTPVIRSLLGFRLQ